MKLKSLVGKDQHLASQGDPLPLQVFSTKNNRVIHAQAADHLKNTVFHNQYVIFKTEVM